MGDGDVVEDEVEPPRSAREVFTHETGDHLTLGDELGSVELRDDGLEDFVDDGREDAFVVVGTKFSVAGKTALIKVKMETVGKKEESAHIVGRSFTEGRERTRQVMLT